MAGHGSGAQRSLPHPGWMGSADRPRPEENPIRAAAATERAAAMKETLAAPAASIRYPALAEPTIPATQPMAFSQGRPRLSACAGNRSVA